MDFQRRNGEVDCLFPSFLVFSTPTIASCSFQRNLPSSTSTSLKNDHRLPTSALARQAQFHFFGLRVGEFRKGMLLLLAPPEQFYLPLLTARAGTPDRGPPIAGVAPLAAPPHLAHEVAR